jgi:hypothetical protein
MSSKRIDIDENGHSIETTVSYERNPASGVMGLLTQRYDLTAGETIWTRWASGRALGSTPNCCVSE